MIIEVLSVPKTLASTSGTVVRHTSQAESEAPHPMSSSKVTPVKGENRGKDGKYTSKFLSTAGS